MLVLSEGGQIHIYHFGSLACLKSFETKFNKISTYGLILVKLWKLVLNIIFHLSVLSFRLSFQESCVYKTYFEGGVTILIFKGQMFQRQGLQFLLSFWLEKRFLWWTTSFTLILNVFTIFYSPVKVEAEGELLSDQPVVRFKKLQRRS